MLRHHTVLDQRGLGGGGGGGGELVINSRPEQKQVEKKQNLRVSPNGM